MPEPYLVVDGKIQAPMLEINVVEHCNLACQSCSHLSPVLPARRVDAPTVHHDLDILGRRYHATRMRLVGGEPLLHPDLPAIVDAVRSADVADLVEIVTNGVLLPRMSAALWETVDCVDVSLYPGRELSDEDQRACRLKAEANGVELRLNWRDSFRESYSEVGTDDGDLIRRIYESCMVAHVWRCHTVADGRFYKCPQAYLLPKLVGGLRGQAAVDSIAIEDGEAFGRDLLAYLQSAEPLGACGYCLGTAGRRFAHTQVARVEFRRRQERRAEDLVDATLLGA
jgi:organic radical activating enzyme